MNTTRKLKKSPKRIPDLCACVVYKILSHTESIIMEEQKESHDFFCTMSKKRCNHETFLKQCDSMHQNVIEIENKHRTLKNNICCNHIDRFKYDEE